MIRLALLLLLLGWAACVEAAPCSIEPTEMFAGALTTTANTVVYTVPVGKKAVVTSIHVTSNATGSTTRTIYVKAIGASIFGGFVLAANQSYNDMIGVVLNAGRTITAWQGVGADVDLIISGALYTC